ncbi:MAG: cardiolipin synthase [Amnibacterium sp.]
MILVQLLWQHLSTVVLVVLEVALFLLALVIAPRNRQPTAALAWILVIVALPIIGIGLFLLIGSPKLPEGRRERQRHMNERIEQDVESVEHPVAGPDVPEWLPSVVRLNREAGAFPLVDGNRARILASHDEQLEAIVAVLDGAERYAHLEFYTFALDPGTRPVFAAIERAQARGVRLRVLIDHLGSRKYPGFTRARAELARLGVPSRLMLPVQPLRGRYQRPDLRNHRKLVIADGAVALLGSPNLIEPGYELARNHRRGLVWHDLLVEVRGPVVQQADAVFATDWFSETGDELPTTAVGGVADDEDPETLLCQLAPSGPAFEAENNLALFNSLIYAAERRVAISTPYFVPDPSLLGAILTAARRGVEVELFVGATADQALVLHAQHSYYEALLDAGVIIQRYEAPTVLHAKHMSVDETVTVVGSSNMDIRSFQLDFEVTMLVSNRDFTMRMRAVEDDYRAHSTRLTPEEWAGRSAAHRWADDLARLTSALQ